MSTVKIDNKDYTLDTLSQEAKAQLEMLLFVDAKNLELQKETAVAQTARSAYANALQALLPKEAN